MSRQTIKRFSALLLVMALYGCDFSDSAIDGESIDVELVAGNALSANALSANALSANALSANALSANALSANALLDTEEGRIFTAYLVRCALRKDQTISVQVGQVTYTFRGLLGIAPEWSAAPLPWQDHEWVSACLFAHVNDLEISVPIALRGVGWNLGQPLLAEPREALEDYSVYEATFYGNLFGAEIEAYTCWGDDPADAHERAPTRELRRCADPAGEGDITHCGFVSMGMCAEVCDQEHQSTGVWRKCRGESVHGATFGAKFKATMGVWLRAKSSSPGGGDDDGDDDDGAGDDAHE